MKRRNFIKKIALGAGFFTIIPAVSWTGDRNVMPNDRIQIGVIGLGKRGSGLLRSLLNDPQTSIVALCDVDAKKLDQGMKMVESFYTEKNGKPFKGCTAYSDFREIIKRQDVDAVAIATPDHWHAIPAIIAARAGKDIYCEKPMSLTLAEARAMVHEVRRYNRVFQTGSQQRSDSRFRHACELVRNGYIGDITKINVSISTGFQAHPIICELPAEPVPTELDWEMWLGPAPDRPYNPIIAPPISFNGWAQWRDYRDYSGGGMTDWGAHHFDIAQWAMGMDQSGPVEVMPPSKEVEKLTYRYQNGTIMETDFDSNYVRFTGTDGWIQVNRQYIKTFPESLTTHIIRPNEITLYNSNDHIGDWLQAIKKREKPTSDVEVGCRSVSVCHIGNISVQLGRKLGWDPGKEEFINDNEANRLRERTSKSPWLV